MRYPKASTVDRMPGSIAGRKPGGEQHQIRGVNLVGAERSAVDIAGLPSHFSARRTSLSDDTH